MGGLCEWQVQATDLSDSLKTQTALVQHEEKELEKKRQHCEYICGVPEYLTTDAFQTSALWKHSKVRSNFLGPECNWW